MGDVLYPVDHAPVLGRDGRMNGHRRTDYIIDVPKSTLSVREMEKQLFPVYDVTGPKHGWKRIGNMTMREFLEKFG